MKEHPNILLIITDQQSSSMMSCSGNKWLRTPNIDYLAKHGTRFDNAYCTDPVCIPSRFSLMTGLYPSDLGFIHNDYQCDISGIPDSILSNGIGRLLSYAGYDAVYGGKEHLPYFDASDLGFHYITSDERWDLAHTCADYITNRQQDDRPFMMVASFINPHDICLMALNDFAAESDNEEDRFFATSMKCEVATMLDAKRIPQHINEKIFYETICPQLPENFLPAKDEPEAVTYLQNKRPFKKLARERYSEDQWRLHRWAYARLTELVDTQIGIILDALINSNQFDNTIIIFTSDHGDMDSSHKCEHKTLLYPECCKVPLIIKGVSSINAGTVTHDLVSNGLDLIKTIADYAGLDLPIQLRGHSLKNIVETADASPVHDHVVVESECGVMATDGRYQYSYYYIGKNNHQFYDLSTNPGCMYNQIMDAKYAGRVAFLKQKIEKHIGRSF